MITYLIIDGIKRGQNLNKLRIAILLHVHTFKGMLLNILTTIKVTTTSTIELGLLGLNLIILLDIYALLNLFVVIHKIIQLIQILVILNWSLRLSRLNHFSICGTGIMKWVGLSNYVVVNLLLILDILIATKIRKIIYELIITATNQGIWLLATTSTTRWTNNIWKWIICQTRVSHVVLVWIIHILFRNIIIFWLFTWASEAIIKRRKNSIKQMNELGQLK